MATNQFAMDANWSDDDLDDATWEEIRKEAIEKGWILEADAPEKQPKKEVEPPRDKDGNVLGEADINEALTNLYATKLNIDTDVRRIEDPEEQALAAKMLKKRYDDLEKDLKDKLKAIQKYNDSRYTAEGVDNYGLESVEGNASVTEMVSDAVGWWEDELQKLKDRLGERVRADIKDLRAEGLDINDRVRDHIYEALVDEEIIEAWEPLEL